VHNPVGVDALYWKELPTPTPGTGQVLIEIKAVSLNFPNLLIVQNKYQMKPVLPFVRGPNTPEWCALSEKA
jgi:NADPH2:quinone reductase